MYRTELNLVEWLQMHQRMVATSGLRAIWLELLFDYASRAREVSSSYRILGRAHDLTASEMRGLLKAFPYPTMMLGDVLANLVQGADPDAAVELYETFPGLHPSETIHWPQHCKTKVRHALAINPRVSKDYHRQFGPFGTKPLEMRNARKGSPDSEARRLQVNRSRMRFLDNLTGALVQEFGEDAGAWRMFFQLWEEGDFSASAGVNLDSISPDGWWMIETVKATL